MQESIKKSFVKLIKFIFLILLPILVAIHTLLNYDFKKIIIQYSPTSYIFIIFLILINYFIFLIYELKNKIDRLNAEINELKKTDELFEHDIKLFNKSKNILDEDKLIYFIDKLERDHSYFKIEFGDILKFIKFHSKESNKYLSTEINNKCNNLVESLNNLSGFLSTNCFEYPQRALDKEVQYCLQPDLNIDRKGSGTTQEMKEYSKYKNQLYDLSEKVSNNYKEYRKAIKNKLYI